MSTRRSIDPPGIPGHKNPVPLASVVGNILMSSAIMGQDPETGAFPADRAQQVALAFDALGAVLETARARADQVVKMDLYLADKADRELVNPHWLEMFPDAASRPARHALQAELPPGCCIQIVIMAVLG